MQEDAFRPGPVGAVGGNSMPGPDNPSQTCAGGGTSAELSHLDDAARRRFLVSRTAMLTTLFHRWTSTHRGGGLSYSSIRVLELLDCTGTAIMRDLADQLGVSPRNMTAAVDALEAAGLVKRVAHPNDRRAILVELTSEGARTAARADGEVESIATIFDALSAEEQEQLLRLLDRVVEQVGRACNQGSCSAARQSTP